MSSCSNFDDVIELFVALSDDVDPAMVVESEAVMEVDILLEFWREAATGRVAWALLGGGEEGVASESLSAIMV